MNTKHTPGEWSLSKAKHMGGEYVVATLAHDRGDRALVVHAPHGDPSQDDANAQLIIAARDLLEAAEIGLHYIEAVCFNTPNPKKRENYARAASKIRAAITKATGASHVHDQ